MGVLQGQTRSTNGLVVTPLFFAAASAAAAFLLRCIRYASPFFAKDRAFAWAFREELRSCWISAVSSPSSIKILFSARSAACWHAFWRRCKAFFDAAFVTGEPDSSPPRTPAGVGGRSTPLFSARNLTGVSLRWRLVSTATFRLMQSSPTFSESLGGVSPSNPLGHSLMQEWHLDGFFYRSHPTARDKRRLPMSPTSQRRRVD